MLGANCWLVRGLFVIAVLVISGCGTTKYTVDDGRAVNPVLYENIQLLGQGERLLRPAIAKSATLNDPDCDRQWELPFSVATSYEWAEDDRVAWVRALQVDERLSVIAAAPESGLEIGDKLIDLDGYRRNNSQKMLLELAELRESGKPFPVETAGGKKLTVKPFEVCRGYTRLAPPDKPKEQDYHWLMSIHPLEIFQPDISPDEALWMVLWTQGLSEEGGARMKTFHYSKKFVMTVLDIASLAMGLNGAAQAAKVAASQVSKAASESASKAASEAAARQIIESAAKDASENAAKEYAQKIGQEILKGASKELGSAVSGSVIARAGTSLSGISWVATTVFDYADVWAANRMLQLGAQPIAGATLHRKLMNKALIGNAFVLDEERIGNLVLNAKKTGGEEMLAAALRGDSSSAFSLQLIDLSALDAESNRQALPSHIDSPSLSSEPNSEQSNGYVSMPSMTD